MIYAFLGIAAAVIAAAVLSVSAHKPKAKLREDIIFSGYDSDETDVPRHDMLIGSLSSLPQLSVCLEHNFYHIPAKLVPIPPENIRYVAVYQSRRFFGSENAGVRYFAEVERATLLPRYAITELPRNSSEMYIRFDLKPWQKRIVPIAPGNKGLVAGYTEYELFCIAEELPQLWLKDKEEASLYAALKTAATGGEGEYCGVQIRKKGKSLLGFRNGKVTAVCTFKSFENAPLRTVHSFIRQI